MHSCWNYNLAKNFDDFIESAGMGVLFANVLSVTVRLSKFPSVLDSILS